MRTVNVQGSYHPSDHRLETCELAQDLAAGQPRSLWAPDEETTGPARCISPSARIAVSYTRRPLRGQENPGPGDADRQLR